MICKSLLRVGYFSIADRTMTLSGANSNSFLCDFRTILDHFQTILEKLCVILEQTYFLERSCVILEHLCVYTRRWYRSVTKGYLDPLKSKLTINVVELVHHFAALYNFCDPMSLRFSFF